MKTIATFLLILCMGFGLRAQTKTDPVKVLPLETGISSVLQEESVEDKERHKVVRLYKYRVSRIKKALSFTAKKNGAKIV